ncbi:MAG: hypothetical protein R3B13_15370 [Polyangiaceae bacterium]
MQTAVDHNAQTAYYAAALRALRFVEARKATDRRFGSEADARWNAVKGHLETIDRLDVLIRDADAQWPGAFGARTVFGLRAVAEDDAFGAEWQPLRPVHGEELWRAERGAAAPASPRALLDACAKAWDFELASFDLGSVRPADKLVVVGPSAIAAAIVAFAGAAGLDWSDQVACVATPPGHRQLAALAGPLLNLNRATELLSPELDGDATADKKLTQRRIVISDDASAVDAAWARSMQQA